MKAIIPWTLFRSMLNKTGMCDRVECDCVCEFYPADCPIVIVNKVTLVDEKTDNPSLAEKEK